MQIVLARNHDEFEAFLRKRYTYVGDAQTLEQIDPATVDGILYLDGAFEHPLYLSDALFDFQCEVSRAFHKHERNDDVEPE